MVKMHQRQRKDEEKEYQGARREFQSNTEWPTELHSSW